MSRDALLLLCLNFLFIGALPRIFFRRGGFPLLWWMTALPLFIAPAAAILMYFGHLHAIVVGTRTTSWLAAAAVVLDACSIALIAFTVGTNRVPLALWHQSDDAPKNIVTFGAYRHVRHPFYVSFLIALTAALLLAPHVATLLTLVYGFTILNFTAAGEEKRLSASTFGDEYRQYMGRTGRFFPRRSRR